MSEIEKQAIPAKLMPIKVMEKIAPEEVKRLRPLLIERALPVHKETLKACPGPSMATILKAVDPSSSWQLQHFGVDAIHVGHAARIRDMCNGGYVKFIHDYDTHTNPRDMTLAYFRAPEDDWYTVTAKCTIDDSYVHLEASPDLAAGMVVNELILQKDQETPIVGAAWLNGPAWHWIKIYNKYYDVIFGYVVKSSSTSRAAVATVPAIPGIAVFKKSYRHLYLRELRFYRWR